MIARRALLGGVLSSVCFGSGSIAQEGDIVCSTIDPPPTTFSLEQYAASDQIELGTFNEAVEAAVRQFNLTPFGTAFLNGRWRRSDGLTPGTGKITLGVHFLGGTLAQQNDVRAIAPEWTTGPLASKFAFQFDVSPEKSLIRVDFLPEKGNNSKVGRQNKQVPLGLHTMNLQQPTRYAILHEFGHVLGLHHEHMHPAIGIQWNESAVIAEMNAKYGWSPETTRQNLLTKFGKEAACIGDPPPNPQSIMMYAIPERWTLNGFFSQESSKISDRDRQCVIGLYSV